MVNYNHWYSSPPIKTVFTNKTHAAWTYKTLLARNADFFFLFLISNKLAPVFQRMENAVHGMVVYMVDSVMIYPPFEQPGPWI